jgi:hypothetical protein
VLWAWMAPPIYAQPSFPAAVIPGLESDPAGTVVPKVCTVSVTGGMVRVDLSVGTVAEAPALLLNGASFGWNGPSDSHSDRHFPELEVRVDGAPITPEDRFEAFVGKTNVTNLIKMAEMDPWAISRTPPVTSARPKNAQVLNALTHVGAVEPSGDQYLAKWTARRLLRIPLKAVPLQRAELDYTARPASSVMTMDQLDTTSREKSYCISPKELRRLTGSGPVPTSVTVNEYSIPAGIDGRSPTSVILNFSKNAGRGANSSAYIFFCGPHGKPMAKKTSVTRERAEVDDQGTLRVLTVAVTSSSQ